MRAIEVYRGSDGEVTRAYYAQLVAKWRIGTIAMNLFRAQKCSSRAKVYRGGIRGQGSYRSMAYDRKAYSLQELSKALLEASDLGIRFGWAMDFDTPLGGRPSWVLYIDLPNGQVSFHSPTRYGGPDYSGKWDGRRSSEYRILAFCDAVNDGYMTDILESLEDTLGETTGDGVQKTMPANGVHDSDRSEAEAAEVLLGRLPAKRRQRGTRGAPEGQTSFVL